MSHGNESHDMPARRIEAVAPGLKIGAIVLVLVGAIAFAVGLATDPHRAWRAYHMNWLYFTAIAQGMVMLAVVVSITKGMWSRPIRRFALAGSAFLPISYLMLLPLLFIGADYIFPWIPEPLTNGKEVWLNKPLMVARTLLLMGVLFGLSLVFAYTALRPDMGLMRDRVPPRLSGLYGRFTRNWRGQEAEELHAYRRLTVLGPVTVLVFALAMGVLAWDFVMSLEPAWFSTLIGPYVFMGGFLGGLMVTALITLALRGRLNLHEYITGSTLHDLGKLCFGFTIFWAYLFFSQYIVIWYGLLPHEQHFMVQRLEMPYRTVAQIVGLCVFVLPFFGLLSVAAKRTPAIFATFACVSLFGLWLERYILVYPSLYEHVEHLPLGWQEPGLLLLFAGLFIAAISFFLTRVPAFQVWQPYSEIELQGVEVVEGQRYTTGQLGGAGSRPD